MMKRKKRGVLVAFIFMLVLAGLLLSRVYRPEAPVRPEIRISAEQAAEHVDRPAEVCGEVVSAAYLPQTAGRPLFLNFGRPHPDQVFTVVIWGEHRDRWDEAPERLYEGRGVCVRGVIRMHEGTPQIVVSDPSRIRLQTGAGG